MSCHPLSAEFSVLRDRFNAELESLCKTTRGSIFWMQLFWSYHQLPLDLHGLIFPSQNWNTQQLIHQFHHCCTRTKIAMLKLQHYAMHSCHSPLYRNRMQFTTTIWKWTGTVGDFKVYSVPFYSLYQISIFFTKLDTVICGFVLRYNWYQVNSY